MKPFNSTTFLTIYSAVVTAAFVFTVWHGVGVQTDFDRLTVHRIDLVEPDGTPRLIISNRAQFPGMFIDRKEMPRPDRKDDAGMVFINEEGTENGGLLFSGYKGKDGALHSSGHLSFDEYRSDQTLEIQMQQDGNERYSLFGLSDMPTRDYTPEESAARATLMAMSAGPAKEQALRAFRAAHPEVGEKPRIRLMRSNRGAATLRIADTVGNDRIEIGVDASGNPSLVFLDSEGKTIKRWP
jgi:hypothetical protein